MELKGSRVLLTGAGSGIGRHLALLLAAKGARLALVGRNAPRLEEVAEEIARSGGEAHPFAFDVSRETGQAELVEDAIGRLGGLDMLVNNAGVMSFCTFSSQDAEDIGRLVSTNLTGPMLLTRAVLPHLMRQNSGRIVNVGSTFGTIGFGHFSVYCATKFAMRGFSESLRRELDHTRIGVTYVAPRATRTALNTDRVVTLNQETGITMDEPEDVAALIVDAIAREAKDSYIGWPEKFFARLNALFPRLVDQALKKNNRIARGVLNPSEGTWK